MSEQVKPAPKAYQANVFWDNQDCATLSAQVYLASDADSYIDALHAEAEALRSENERLRSLINTPHTDEWIDAVRLEAAYQIERWGTSHDSGKTPADWFWLLGYLGQKAMVAQMAGDEEKAKHHTISSGAMLLNWFRAVVGDTNAMRPGIEVKK